MDESTKKWIIKATAFDKIREVLIAEDDPAKAGILALTLVIETEKIIVDLCTKKGGE